MKNNLVKFEDLIAWQRARELASRIYSLGKTGLLAKEFGLRDQLQRSATAIMAYLVEGFESMSTQVKIECWRAARVTAGEVKSMLYVIADNQLASEDDIAVIQKMAGDVSALALGLLRAQQARTTGAAPAAGAAQAGKRERAPQPLSPGASAD